MTELEEQRRPAGRGPREGAGLSWASAAAVARRARRDHQRGAGHPVRPDPHLLRDVPRRPAAAGASRRSTRATAPRPGSPSAFGVLISILAALVPLGGDRQAGQHRHAVRVRPGQHRRDHPAPDPARTWTGRSGRRGAGVPDHRHPALRLPDDRPAAGHLDPVRGLAGRRPADLRVLRLQALAAAQRATTSADERGRPTGRRPVRVGPGRRRLRGRRRPGTTPSPSRNRWAAAGARPGDRGHRAPGRRAAGCRPGGRRVGGLRARGGRPRCSHEAEGSGRRGRRGDVPAASTPARRRTACPTSWSRGTARASRCWCSAPGAPAACAAPSPAAPPTGCCTAPPPRSRWCRGATPTSRSDRCAKVAVAFVDTPEGRVAFDARRADRAAPVGASLTVLSVVPDTRVVPGLGESRLFEEREPARLPGAASTPSSPGSRRRRGERSAAPGPGRRRALGPVPSTTATCWSAARAATARCAGCCSAASPRASYATRRCR